MRKVRNIVISILLFIVAAMIAAYILAGWNEQPMDDAARSNATGAFLETSQGKVHYQWFGEEGAPVIVMAHGFSTPGFIYDQNAKALAADGYRVLTFDHLGRGWSDRPVVTYDDQFYEQELLDVLNGLGLDEPIGLVGLSMGGGITSYFAGQNPERVAALFLFVPAGFDLSTAPSSSSAKLLATPVVGDWIWRVFGKSMLLGDPQYDETKLDKASKLQGDVAEQMNYEGYFGALLSTFRNMPMYRRDDIFSKLATTGVPVKALFGSDDPTVLPSSLARFDRLVPSGEGVMIEGRLTWSQLSNA